MIAISFGMKLNIVVLIAFSVPCWLNDSFPIPTRPSSPLLSLMVKELGTPSTGQDEFIHSVVLILNTFCFKVKHLDHLTFLLDSGAPGLILTS